MGEAAPASSRRGRAEAYVAMALLALVRGEGWAAAGERGRSRAPDASCSRASEPQRGAQAMPCRFILRATVD